MLTYIKDGTNVCEINQLEIDIAHLAATTLGYTNRTPKEWIVPDFWTGWGGDLATEMRDVTMLANEGPNNRDGIPEIVI